jgi:hypothetical protein
MRRRSAGECPDPPPGDHVGLQEPPRDAHRPVRVCDRPPQHLPRVRRHDPRRPPIAFESVALRALKPVIALKPILEHGRPGSQPGGRSLFAQQVEEAFRFPPGTVRVGLNLAARTCSVRRPRLPSRPMRLPGGAAPAPSGGLAPLSVGASRARAGDPSCGTRRRIRRVPDHTAPRGHALQLLHHCPLGGQLPVPCIEMVDLRLQDCRA